MSAEHPGYQPPAEPDLPCWWPAPIAILAIAAALLALGAAPSIPAHGPPQWFEPFFSTAAGTIAALFIALALGTIQTHTSVPAAIITVTYIVLGELTALAGLCTELPPDLYRWLLALTVAAGTGALASALVIGAKSISSAAWQRREENLATIANRTLADAASQTPVDPRPGEDPDADPGGVGGAE